MLRSIFLIGSALFWLTMMSLHIHREYFQLKPIYAPYQVLPLHNLYLREEYRGIYLGDTLLGFTLTVLERMEDPPELKDKKKEVVHTSTIKEESESAKNPSKPESLYELRHHSYMTFRFLGEEREMLIRSKALLNARLEMEGFAMKATSGEYQTEIEGHTQGQNMELVITEKGASPVQKIIPVVRPLYYSESLSMIWTPENLQTGKKGRLSIWNPITLTSDAIEFRVNGKEKITHENKEIEVYLVYIVEKGMETRYWITPEGILLKHESATGLTLVKQDGWKIFEGLRENRHSLLDLPNLYSVPSNKTIAAPEKLIRLKARVTDSKEEKIITNESPDIKSAKEILISSLSGREDLALFVQADDFIQSDNPEILEIARKIVGSENRAWFAAHKIMEWVHGYVQPTPTISLPSALQVLKQRQGDCNEFTVLYTAIARAAGIPARMVAGLVYQNGRFFYHAWPEIYAGQWIRIDPTFAQAPADVTHLPLAEGNLSEQVDLVRKLGSIKVTVLETA